MAGSDPAKGSEPNPNPKGSSMGRAKLGAAIKTVKLANDVKRLPKEQHVDSAADNNVPSAAEYSRNLLSTLATCDSDFDKKSQGALGRHRKTRPGFFTQNKFEGDGSSIDVFTFMIKGLDAFDTRFAAECRVLSLWTMVHPNRDRIVAAREAMRHMNERIVDDAMKPELWKILSMRTDWENCLSGADLRLISVMTQDCERCGSGLDNKAKGTLSSLQESELEMCSRFLQNDYSYTTTTKPLTLGSLEDISPALLKRFSLVRGNKPREVEDAPAPDEEMEGPNRPEEKKYDLNNILSSDDKTDGDKGADDLNNILSSDDKTDGDKGADDLNNILSSDDKTDGDKGAADRPWMPYDYALVPLYDRGVLARILECCSAPVRRDFLNAHKRNASDENVAMLKEIVKTRHMIALTLGYECWPSYRLERAFIQDPKRLMEFLVLLTKRCKKANRSEVDKLKAFKESECNSQGEQFDYQFHSYDYTYYMKKMYDDDFPMNSGYKQRVREFFPLVTTLQKLLAYLSTMLSLRFLPCEQKSLPMRVWHSSVYAMSVFKVNPLAPADDQLTVIGVIYFDLYARNHKLGATAFYPLWHRTLAEDGSLQRPAASVIIGSFDRENNSLLYFEEMKKLFHELSHAVHHSMITPSLGRLAAPLDEDFLELLGHFHEALCHEEFFLLTVSTHYKNSAALPPFLISAINEGRRWKVASKLQPRLINALFDLAIHTPVGKRTPGDINLKDIYKTICDFVTIVDIPESYAKCIGSMTPLVQGLDLARYRDLWAEVFAVDILETMIALSGMPNREIRPNVFRHFAETFYSPGGSQPTQGLVWSFLGRDFLSLGPYLYLVGAEDSLVPAGEGDPTPDSMSPDEFVVDDFMKILREVANRRQG